jgi:hypothetical protein
VNPSEKIIEVPTKKNFVNKILSDYGVKGGSRFAIILQNDNVIFQAPSTKNLLNFLRSEFDIQSEEEHTRENKIPIYEEEDEQEEDQFLEQQRALARNQSAS